MVNSSHDYSWLDGTKFHGFQGLIQFNVLAADTKHDCVCVQKNKYEKVIEAKSVDCLDTGRAVCHKTGNFQLFYIKFCNGVMVLKAIFKIISS